MLKSVDRRFFKKKFFPIMIMDAIKPNDRLYLVIFDPRCMAGRIYGTTSCGPYGFREDVLANDSMSTG